MLCVQLFIFPHARRDHVLSRLEHVWGPGDGRPVEELKVAIDQVSRSIPFRPSACHVFAGDCSCGAESVAYSIVGPQ